MSYEIRIIGGGIVGRRLADRLEFRGDRVIAIEHDQERAATLESDGYRVHHGDGTDVETLDDAGTADADVVIVATGDDDTNLLVAQLVRNRFSPDAVISRVNNPENEEPFEELGIQTVSRSGATAKMLDAYVESPALTRWMQSVGHKGEVQEIPVENDEFASLTVRELDERLPEQALLVMISEEGTAHLPDEDEVVEQGDHVTVIGARNAVREVMNDLTGEGLSTGEATTTDRPRHRQ